MANQILRVDNFLLNPQNSEYLLVRIAFCMDPLLVTYSEILSEIQRT